MLSTYHNSSMVVKSRRSRAAEGGVEDCHGNFGPPEMLVRAEPYFQKKMVRHGENWSVGSLMCACVNRKVQCGPADPPRR